MSFYQFLKKIFELTRKIYRPINILLNVSKTYEKCLNKQLEECFQALLYKYQCGFWKGYSVTKFLLPMIKKWRKSFEEGGAFGALITNLSKPSLVCLMNC